MTLKKSLCNSNSEAQLTSSFVFCNGFLLLTVRHFHKLQTKINKVIQDQFLIRSIEPELHAAGRGQRTSWSPPKAVGDPRTKDPSQIIDLKIQKMGYLNIKNHYHESTIVE